MADEKAWDEGLTDTQREAVLEYVLNIQAMSVFRRMWPGSTEKDEITKEPPVPEYP